MDWSVMGALFSLDVRDLLAAAWHVSAGSVTGRASVWVPLHPPTWPANRDRDGGGGGVDGAVTRLSLWKPDFWENFVHECKLPAGHVAKFPSNFSLPLRNFRGKMKCHRVLSARSHVIAARCDNLVPVMNQKQIKGTNARQTYGQMHFLNFVQEQRNFKIFLKFVFKKILLFTKCLFFISIFALVAVSQNFYSAGVMKIDC